MPRFSYTDTAPVITTFLPSLGIKLSPNCLFLNMTADIAALLSLRVKYQWPELAGLKFESSPSIEILINEFSSISLIRELISVTEKILDESGLDGLKLLSKFIFTKTRLYSLPYAIK